MAVSMNWSSAPRGAQPRCSGSTTCSSHMDASSCRRAVATGHGPARRHGQALHRVLQSTHVRGRPAAATPASQVAEPAAAIEALPGWVDSLAAVQALGCSEEQAASYVQRAFGWGTKAQAYWRRAKVQASPDAAQVQRVIDYLKELGLNDAGILKVVQGFPEVLGCRVGLLEVNAAKLEKEWKLTGDVRAKAILRQPGILGYTIDCMGDCAGECNRCWVRF